MGTHVSSPLRSEGSKSLLHYVEAGDPQARPIVLLLGLGMRLEEWPQHWIARLAKTRRVIRIDNRDAGRSPQYGPDQDQTAVDIWMKQDAKSAAQATSYTLYDMCDDVLEVLDYLGITEFDLAGFSMGGLISQLVAATAGDRVGTFVQLASGDGSNNVDGQSEAMQRMSRLFVAPPSDAALRQFLIEDAIFYSAGALSATDDLVTEVERFCALGYAHGGAARHALAVLGTDDRTDYLKRITARSLILHGDQDPCIAAERGRRAAALIPYARFELLLGVGHVLDADMLDLAAKFLLNDTAVGD
ncbi:alpha/beta fold hydrolase [Phaeobacter sp. 11ANDIMAR09]|uniref:alpha/beta fold hydrolase n=1 Tax=Phaeobacter sp. 11ANDIMAR09 TaxID=1225647 RepID=UPI0006C8A213|nr:alpha/beta hydrolase [Phaeobacter sp. 11ANDIMAR09]